MNALTLARFSRDAYLTAMDAREKVVEHADAETNEGREMVHEVELAARCATSTYGGALELLGCTDNEAANDLRLPHFLCTMSRCLILAKPLLRSKPEPKPIIEPAPPCRCHEMGPSFCASPMHKVARPVLHINGYKKTPADAIS